MNELVKKAWLNALRSGKYKQGQGRLRKGNAFCCLGVLCDLHSKQTGIKWEMIESSVGKRLGYKWATLVLPEEVREWADLESRDPHVPYAFGEDALHHHHRTVSSFNDDGSTFKEIADLIEAHL